MKTKNRIYSTILLGGLLLGSGNLVAAEGPKMPPTSVVVADVVEIGEVGLRKYVGYIDAIEEVTLIARVSGFLESLTFQEGEIVKKGQPLIQIEDTAYQAQKKSAEAKVAQINAELTYAKTNYERQAGLAKREIISEHELEEATRLLHFRQAGLAEAEATLINAENDLSYTKIVAPITGRIGKATYSAGNYVTLSSNKLASIVQVAPIYVRFSMSESDYLSIFGTPEVAKERAVIRIQTADKLMYPEKGKIALVDNKIDSNTGTIMIWATFENKDMKLNPGGFATVFLSKESTQTEKKPAVKISAIQTDETGSNFVFVLNENNQALKRPVKVGEIVDNMQIILEGLKAGERVVVDGVHKIMMPGMTVIPYPETQASGGDETEDVEIKVNVE